MFHCLRLLTSDILKRPKGSIVEEINEYPIASCLKKKKITLSGRYSEVSVEQ